MEQCGDGLLSPTYEENCTHPKIQSRVFEKFLKAGVCMIALQIRKPKLKSITGYFPTIHGNLETIKWFINGFSKKSFL